MQNRLRVFSKQTRRCRDNKRVLPLFLQERIFYLQNKQILIFYGLSIQLFTCNLKPISDIDECVVDTHHNCSSDAFCNNTHGSFNCTCKPGFTGDGQKCTGSMFSGMSVLVWQQKLYLFSLVISPCYNLLLIAKQQQGWIQGRWIGRLATSPVLAALLVC